MKKKEVLIIFVLAVLVTGGSWFYCREVTIPVGGFGLIEQRVCGWPLWYWYETKGSFGFVGAFLDFLFWLLVIFGVWWVVKWVRGKYGRSN